MVRNCNICIGHLADSSYLYSLFSASSRSPSMPSLLCSAVCYCGTCPSLIMLPTEFYFLFLISFLGFSLNQKLYKDRSTFLFFSSVSAASGIASYPVRV